MCMISAVIPTQTSISDEELSTCGVLFTELLIANSRNTNKDGTGMASVLGDFIKWNLRAEEVAYSPDWNEMLRVLLSNKRPFIGHVRAASTGKKAEEGAHPFIVGDTLLIHNGTFHDYEEVAKSLSISPDLVDSHIFCHLLNKMREKGPITQDIIIEALKKIKGGFALMLIDLTSNDLWITRSTMNLHFQNVGPFKFFNTSDTNLSGMAKKLAHIHQFYTDSEWKLGESTQVEAYKVFKLVETELVEMGVFKYADVSVPVITTYKDYSGKNTVVGMKGTKKVSTNAAVAKARHIHALGVDYGVTLSDVYTLIHGIDAKMPWYSLSDIELEALYMTVGKLHERCFSEEKESLWFDIKMLSRTPYDASDNILKGKFKVPYYLNTVEDLKRIRNGLDNTP